MTNSAPAYRGYRFPPEIISHAVWLYHRFGLSFRDAEDLLAERGVTVTYESIRQWCQTFGPNYARRLRRRRGRLGDTWHLDELFVRIQSRRQYLWRTVDQDGDVLDILVQPRRNRQAAARFFRRLLKRQGRVPTRLITNKLRSYAAAHRQTIPSVPHCTTQYENNRVEVSHLAHPAPVAESRSGIPTAIPRRAPVSVRCGHQSRTRARRAGHAPRPGAPRLVTDKLRSHAAAHRRTLSSVPHCTTQYENNHAEVSHQATRSRGRLMRQFKNR